MKTLFIKNYYKSRKALTLIELSICIIVAALLFKLVFDFMSNTRQNYMYGVVNLQNLQEARLAINYLRRDFSSCCPMFTDPIESQSDGYVNFQKTRKQLFVTQNTKENFSGDLIQIHEHGLLFHKYLFGSYGEHPKVESVTYQFDKSSKTLVRTSDTKGRKTFAGFEDVDFALYAHEINPSVPVLWVKFRIHESSNIYASDKIGTALELTTTISSSFIDSSQNNKYWRYQTGQIK